MFWLRNKNFFCYAHLTKDLRDSTLVSIIMKYYNRTLQTNPRYREEEIKNITKEDNLSKATNSLPIEMIAIFFCSSLEHSIS